jgi:surface antigen
MSVKKWLAVGLSVILLFLGNESAQATAFGTTCHSADYACTNSGYAGYTGYDGHDGPYGYDTDYTNGGHLDHNCTSYVAWKIYKVIGYLAPYNTLGDAKDWAKRAPVNVPGAIVTKTPLVDYVAQWNFGHVAWVNYVNYDSNGKVLWIVVSDDNLTAKETRQHTLYPGQTSDVGWPDNFIDFPLYGGGGGPPSRYMSQPVGLPII